ncbi:hypothetical protein BC829DRAFT_477322 [Chytridium lagenaria]|nr:hypothetical protein BC829DRAFT_477322 [Chytridium lagenaria]
MPPHPATTYLDTSTCYPISSKKVLPLDSHSANGSGRRFSASSEAAASVTAKEALVEAAKGGVPVANGLPKHFGDIMSSRETAITLPNEFSPLERILLTANGNVQRILSAYYNSPVSVSIKYNTLRPTIPDTSYPITASTSLIPHHQDSQSLRLALPTLKVHQQLEALASGGGETNGTTLGEGRRVKRARHQENGDNGIEDEADDDEEEVLAVFDRVVELIILDKPVCTAWSVVTLSSPEFLRLVVEAQVGIGQLFRFLNVLPEFQLHAVGRDALTGVFWRTYTLSCKGIRCDLREEFARDTFSLVTENQN